MSATSTGRGSFRSALAHRDYRWLFIGNAVSHAGSWAYNVALAVWVYQRTGSAAWVAAASLGRFVPSLVFSVYGGVIAERFERRRVMLVVDLLSVVWMTSLALVAGFDGPVLLAILFASLTTIGGTIFYPADAAMTPQLVGEKDLAAANALNGMVANGAIIVGPGIGAVLLALGPPHVVFFVNGLTFLFSAFCIARVRARSRATDVTEGGSSGFFRQLTVGFKAILESSTALVLVLFSVFASFLYGTDTVLYVMIGEEKIGTGAEGFGLLLAGLGVGGIIGGFFINRASAAKRLGLVITIGMIAYALPTFFMQYVDSPTVAFAIQVLRGAGTLFVDVLAVTALQRSLPPDRIARVFGVYVALVLAAISLGAYVTPLLLGWLELDGTLAVVGLAAPILTVLLYPKVVQIDRANARRLVEIEPRIAFIERLGIFEAASRSIVERLAAAATEVRAGTGDWIIREGDPADAFFVLTGGTVDVVARGEREHEQFIRTLSPGDYFGEIGLIENVPRTASIRAGVGVTMLRIAGSDFLDALTQSPASAGFLEGARIRLQTTHPTRAAVAG